MLFIVEVTRIDYTALNYTVQANDYETARCKALEEALNQSGKIYDTDFELNLLEPAYD